MAYEHKEGSGSLFKNDKKGVENRPDYRGDVMIGGTLYELAAWIKEGKKGKFLSLSASAKEEPRRKAEVPDPDPSNGFDADLGDVPF